MKKKKDNRDGELKSYYIDVDHNHRILIQQNYEFMIGLRVVRQYNALANKKLLFDILPKLKNGELLGEKVGNEYHIELSFNELFTKLYGKVYIRYTRTFDEEDGYYNLSLLSIEPYDILFQFHSVLPKMYKGVPILNDSYKFKIDLLEKLKGGKQNGDK